MESSAFCGKRSIEKLLRNNGAGIILSCVQNSLLAAIKLLENRFIFSLIESFITVKFPSSIEKPLMKVAFPIEYYSFSPFFLLQINTPPQTPRPTTATLNNAHKSPTIRESAVSGLDCFKGCML